MTKQYESARNPFKSRISSAGQQSERGACPHSALKSLQRVRKLPESEALLVPTSGLPQAPAPSEGQRVGPSPRPETVSPPTTDPSASPRAAAGSCFDIKQGDIPHEGQDPASSYDLNHFCRAVELPHALTASWSGSPGRHGPAVTFLRPLRPAWGHWPLGSGLALNLFAETSPSAFTHVLKPLD